MVPRGTRTLARAFHRVSPARPAVILLSRYSHPILWSPGSTTRPRAFPEEETMTLTETTLAATTSTAAASLRPQPGECAPYYDRYLSLVPANDILAALEDQRRQTLLLLCGRTEAEADLRYAPDKWSVKEVLGRVGEIAVGFGASAEQEQRLSALVL